MTILRAPSATADDFDTPEKWARAVCECCPPAYIVERSFDPSLLELLSHLDHIKHVRARIRTCDPNAVAEAVDLLLDVVGRQMAATIEEEVAA